MRGAITTNLTGITNTAARPSAVWFFDDIALICDDTATKTWRCTSDLTVKTDVTATLSLQPLDSRHVRYGDLVYGAVSFVVSPALGSWDGGATTVPLITNAPYGFVDLQVYAQRLFVLGGTVPGTTTVAKRQTLFWTDPGATDLSLEDSWKDDVSGLVNQIVYDGDDTPVALAGCGHYMAILGTRSVNILTGTGASSFAIRNLTRNMGCTDINTVVEADDGFYFMTERGYAFCDGTTISVVSDGQVSNDLTGSTGYTAAMFGHGFVALCSATTCWLFHIPSKSWTQISMDISTSTPCGVYRTNNYPFLWQSGGLRRAELITRHSGAGIDNDGSIDVTIKTSWASRYLRLASPSQLASVQRLLLDYRFASASTDGFRVRLIDALGNVLLDQNVPAQSSSTRRSRFQFDCYGEADTVQLVVTNAATAVAADAELYDAWVEFQPAQKRANV